ncbi:MAG: 3'-5' exoribonuclease [Microscillaceae bacterium]|jgi:hypothetical protein|nr:3'-5' exoribonuclease [Microscillaceae bacterium]
MNIYLDTEFIQTTHHIELISIGLVKANHESYYAVSAEFDPRLANDWVRANVLPYLVTSERKSLATICAEIEAFIGYEMGNFWAFMGVCDWYLILQLYGGMPKLPANFSLFYRELRQEIERLQFPETLYPPRTRAHHALSDAHWAKQLHENLLIFEKNKVV